MPKRRHNNLFTLMSGAFSPTQISGLVGWYDFSDPSVLFTDTARTSPVTADAQTIKGVTDKSGNGNHLSEATNPPTYKVNIQNGKSVSRYLAASTTKLTSSAFTAVADPYTVVVVGQCTTGPTGGNFMNYTSGTAAGHAEVFLQGTGTHPGIYAGTLFTSASTYTTSTWYIYTGTFNGASSKFWTNGGASETGNAGAGNIAALQLGGLGTQFITGDIGACLLYSTALSLSDLNTLGFGLAGQWGVTWTTAS